jgi:hypothetical protein|tara:strand:+ start:3117 stop:4163 length:1047 start_codon:yes stop_codon:yes gene_type:complete
MFNPKENILDQQLAESGLELNIFGTIKDIFTGGASTKNKHAKKQSKEINKFNEKAYKHEGKEIKRRYKHEKESLEIAKRNLEADLRFKQDAQFQEYNYAMGIRDYETAQDLRAYNQSVAQAESQKQFNQVGSDFANLQQDRNLMEQQIELELNEKETLLNYTAQSHGLLLKKKGLKSQAVAELRKSNIAALKASGEAASRGQSGRSGAKTLNAIQAEANAVESEIVEELLNGTSQVDMDLLSSRYQNMQDNLALQLSGNNLVAADRMSRQQIKMQRLQADLDAEASVLLKPTLPPPIPRPFTLPRPEFQDIYKPKQGPKPAKSIPYQANIAGAFFRNSLSIASTVAGL